MTEPAEIRYLRAALQDLTSRNLTAAARNIGEAGRIATAKADPSPEDRKAINHMTSAAEAIRDTGIEIQRNLQENPFNAPQGPQTAAAGAEQAKDQIQMAIDTLQPPKPLTKYLLAGAAGMAVLTIAAIIGVIAL